MVGRDVICDRRSFPTRTLQTVTQEFLEGGHLALDDGRTGGGRRVDCSATIPTVPPRKLSLIRRIVHM